LTNQGIFIWDFRFYILDWEWAIGNGI